jgi:predicted PurR-regulated permease PerM
MDFRLNQTAQRAEGLPVRVPRWLAVVSAWSLPIVVAAAAVYLLGNVLHFFWLAILPVILAVLVATLLAPVSRRLRKWGLPRVLAGFVTLLLGLGLLGGMVALFFFGISGELSAVGQSVKQGYRELVGFAANTAGAPKDSVRDFADQQMKSIQDSAGGLSKALVSQVFGFFETVTLAIVALAFTWFFVWDGDRLFSGFVGFFPARHQEPMRELGDRIWDSVGAYMRGMFVIALADALLFGLGLWIIGQPLIFPLMLLTFLGAMVPFVGPTVAGTVAGLIGLAHGGITQGGLVLLVTLIVQQIEGNLLQPFVFGRAVHLHPALVLFSITAGAVALGIVGIFLAVPVAASLTTLLHLCIERGWLGLGELGPNEEH